MDMLKCFFSNRYAGRTELFEGLSVWQEEKYRSLQGSYPVIYLTFADIKADSYEDSKNSIIAVINEAYQAHRYLLESDAVTDGEKIYSKHLTNIRIIPIRIKKLQMKWCSAP